MRGRGKLPERYEFGTREHRAVCGACCLQQFGQCLTVCMLVHEQVAILALHEGVEKEVEGCHLMGQVGTLRSCSL